MQLPNLIYRAAALVIISLAFAQASYAQYPTNMVPPRRVTDARGVDLVSGQMSLHIPLVSFGENATALSTWIDPGSAGWSGGVVGNTWIDPGSAGWGGGVVSNDFAQTAGAQIGAHLFPVAYLQGADGSPDEFGAYENIVFPNGAGFARVGTGGNTPGYHTNADGSSYTESFGTSHFTRISSSDPNLGGIYDAAGDKGIIDPTAVHQDRFERIILANGEEWRFYREFVTVPCSVSSPAICQSPTVSITRLRFLTSSRGYGIQFLYQSDSVPASSYVAGLWYAPRRVTAYNKAVTYCNESLLQECTAVSVLPSAAIDYDSTAHTVTIREPGSADGVQLIYTQVNGAWIPLSWRHTAVPNSTVTIQTAIAVGGGGYISRVTDSDGQWNYSHINYTDDSGHLPLMSATSTNPAGSQVSIFGYGSFGTIQTYTDELGRTYNYADGYPFRDWGRFEPEWDQTAVDRDERNNVTAITRYPKPGDSGSPMTVYSATYPVDCTNPRTCNHPITTTDGNSNVTDYTYAPEHGGILTQTGPAAPTRQPNGTIVNVRPQIRYEYAQRYAWIANGSGGYAHASTAIWLLTATSVCRTSAATGNSSAPCATAGDEVRTAYDYGPDSGPNTLLLRGQTVTSTDNGVTTTLRTCYGYDSLGHRISTTQPNANLGSCP